MRIPQNLLEELIENEGELRSGPVNTTGILRLALDLKEAREDIDRLEKLLGGKRPADDRKRLETNARLSK